MNTVFRIRDIQTGLFFTGWSKNNNRKYLFSNGGRFFLSKSGIMRSWGNRRFDTPVELVEYAIDEYDVSPISKTA